MDAIIITIGDEILVGQTVDTNSAHIAKELNLLGISVQEIISISDTESHIVNTLNRVMDQTRFIIVTGGLGPTNDDITKRVLTRYFDDQLVLNEAIEKKLHAYFDRFNKPFLAVNQMQAMLPAKAVIFENDLGTASGMLFTKNQTEILSLPGVPYEMKGLFKKFTTHIQQLYPVGDFYHNTVQVIGIGESYLAELLTDWESKNRNEGITVSYLPSVGTLKLRLTGKLKQKNVIDERMNELLVNYPKYVIGGEFDTIEKVVGQLLVDRNQTLGTAESCTGGALASKIVSMPGSSAFYIGSIISYTNDLKEELLGVKNETLALNGAVSEAVVREMSHNGRLKLGVDYCISISGIAGPTGGTELKPVGTVWIGIAGPEKQYARKFNFSHNRERNIEATALAALNFLRMVLTDIK